MLPTVKVKTDAADNEHGFYVINESDFDPAVHELFEEGDETGDYDVSKMTVVELKDALAAAGIAFEPNAKKADLVALLTNPAE